MADGSSARPVQARIRAPCEGLGFFPPPAEIQLRFLRSRSRWVLYVHGRTDDDARLRAWLETYGPATVQHSTSPNSTIVRAAFDTLPARWEHMLDTFEICDFRIEPTGVATLVVEGDRTKVRRELLPGVELHDITHVRTLAPLLTSAQHRALSRAFEAGYYTVPKKVTLTELAASLGTSQASLSELLRRAEARIIARYMQAGSELPVDSFDEAAAWADGGTEVSGHSGATGPPEA